MSTYCDVCGRPTVIEVDYGGYNSGGIVTTYCEKCYKACDGEFSLDKTAKDRR